MRKGDLVSTSIVVQQSVCALLFYGTRPVVGRSGVDCSDILAGNLNISCGCDSDCDINAIILINSLR